LGSTLLTLSFDLAVSAINRDQAVIFSIAYFSILPNDLQFHEKLMLGSRKKNFL